MSGFKIYTKKGDTGYTSLYTGEKVKKSDLIICALGDIDELNSQLGIAVSYIDNNDVLVKIQNILFDIGASIATSQESNSEFKINKTKFNPIHIEMLEKEIDTMTQKMEPLKRFILPGGSLESSHLHVARSITRRAERSLTILLEEQKIDPNIFIFVNRLSDYFFTAARYQNHLKGTEDIFWTKS